MAGRYGDLCGLCPIFDGSSNSIVDIGDRGAVWKEQGEDEGKWDDASESIMLGERVGRETVMSRFDFGHRDFK